MASPSTIKSCTRNGAAFLRSWMRATSFRMVRKGLEEPWRGTLCTLMDQSYLFTGGYVPWWNEYPGMHIPALIELGSAMPTDMKTRSKEILTLTKMN